MPAPTHELIASISLAHLAPGALRGRGAVAARVVWLAVHGQARDGQRASVNTIFASAYLDRVDIRAGVRQLVAAGLVTETRIGPGRPGLTPVGCPKVELAWPPDGSHQFAGRAIYRGRPRAVMLYTTWLALAVCSGAYSGTDAAAWVRCSQAQIRRLLDVDDNGAWTRRIDDLVDADLVYRGLIGGRRTVVVRRV